METIATLLAGAIGQLRLAIDRLAAHEPARAPVLTLASTRLCRIAIRLHALFARFQAGTLPSQTGAAPRPSRAGQPRPTLAESQPVERPRLPRSPAWLLRTPESLRMVAANTHHQVQHILMRPDLAEFLAAAPQAGRLLRPLCHMFGLHAQPGIPAGLHLPEPPPFRPSPPPPPPPYYHALIDSPEVVAHDLRPVRTEFRWVTSG